MGGRKRDEIPPVLARAQVRFRDWRRKRTIGARIPEPLWTLAVKLAIAHGVCRTASALELDYYSLKKRLEAADGTAAGYRAGVCRASRVSRRSGSNVLSS